MSTPRAVLPACLLAAALAVAAAEPATAQPIPEWTYSGPSGRTLAVARGPGETIYAAGATGNPGPPVSYFIARLPESGPPHLWSSSSTETPGELYMGWRPLAVDAEGRSYFAGNVRRPGGRDFWVWQLDADGATGWTYVLPASSVNDNASDVAVDESTRMVYVAGYVDLGGRLVKLSADTGTVEWTYTQNWPFYDVDVDASGDVFLAGLANTVIKLDADGNELWRYVGDWSSEVLLGPSGHVYATGSGFLPSRHLFVVKLSPDGQEEWVARWFGRDHSGQDLALDEEENVYACGLGTDGSEDWIGIIARFDGATGARQWSHAIDGPDGARFMRVDVVDGRVLALATRYEGPSALWLIQYAAASGTVDWDYLYTGATGGGAEAYDMVRGGASRYPLYVCGVDWGLGTAFVQRLGDGITAVHGVSEVRAVAQGESIVLNWRGSPSEWAGFHLDRTESGTGTPGHTDFVRLTPLPIESRTGCYTYVDRAVDPGAGYTYRIVGLRPSGQEVLAGSLHAIAPAAQLALGPIFPLPLRDRVEIRYAVPDRTGDARLEVIDVAGRICRTLPQGGAPGAVFWDGRGQSGAPVAPGTYFLRLTAGHRSITRKVVVDR